MRPFDNSSIPLLQSFSWEGVVFGLGMPELIVLLVIVLVVFGAGRLPEIGTAVGRAIRGFKKGLSESEPVDVKNPHPLQENHTEDKK